MANPPPVIQSQLGLVTQPLQRSDQSRAALVTVAIKTDNAPSHAEAVNIADAWQTSFNARIAPFMDNEVSVQPPTIRLGAGSTVPFEAVASGAAAAGGTADNFPPPQICFLAKKLSGFGGKTNRGRMYFPYLLHDAAVSENGTVDATFLGLLNTALGQILTDLATTSYVMVIANKVFNQPLPPRFVTHINIGPVVTSFVGESLCATQRRRLGR